MPKTAAVLEKAYLAPLGLASIDAQVLPASHVLVGRTGQVEFILAKYLLPPLSTDQTTKLDDLKIGENGSPTISIDGVAYRLELSYFTLDDKKTYFLEIKLDRVRR
jgi:hypothetical protein